MLLDRVVMLLYSILYVCFFFPDRTSSMEGNALNDPLVENQSRKAETEVDVNSGKSSSDTKEEEKEQIEKLIAKSDVETSALSKRQRKKLLKHQRWLDTRQERKKREKEKLRQRLEAKRAAGEACGNIRKKLKRVTMATSKCKQCVVIDMSFDDLMIEKHLCQCVKQISRCYSANRRVTDPMQLYVTSFSGRCKELMARQNGYDNWDVHFKPEYYMDVFPKDQVVYLTSESENVLTSVDENKVYVIGGLVDHNVHKGLCHKLAVEKSIQHAKLPIDEFIEMKTRKVLTIDHVFRILLGVSHGMSWKDSFLDIIPARKGAVGKDDASPESNLDEKESDEDRNIKSLKYAENVSLQNHSLLKISDEKEFNEHVDRKCLEDKENETKPEGVLDSNTDNKIS